MSLASAAIAIDHFNQGYTRVRYNWTRPVAGLPESTKPSSLLLAKASSNPLLKPNAPASDQVPQRLIDNVCSFTCQPFR